MDGHSRSRKKTNNAELFAFAGMHHIFAEQRSAVNVLCFANETKDLLAFGCADNTISVCTVVSRPAVVATLKGHVGQVTDLDWSIANDYLLSASHDRTARLWQARGGLCARVFNLAQAPWCCRFHPLNNNLFAVGAQSEKGNKGCITVLNTSTGRPVDSFVTHGAVRSLCFDSRGDHLFSGDDKGIVYVHRVHANGALKLLCRNLIGAMPWSLQYKAWFRAGSTRCEPLLLASCKDCTAKVFRVEGLVPPAASAATSSAAGARPGSLTLMYTVPVPCATHVVRAKFCPLLATRDSACIVTGGEDTTVTIYAMFATPPAGTTTAATEGAPATSTTEPRKAAPALTSTSTSTAATAESSPTKAKFKAPKRKRGTGPSPAGVSSLVPLWPSHSNPINRLQGHRDTVTDVSWSYDESLLASCDASGIVIVWKRVRNVSIS